MAKNSGTAKKSPSNKPAASKAGQGRGAKKTAARTLTTAEPGVDPFPGEWGSKIGMVGDGTIDFSDIESNKKKAKAKHSRSSPPTEKFEVVSPGIDTSGKVLAFIRRDGTDHLTLYCGIFTRRAGTSGDPHRIDGKAFRSRIGIDGSIKFDEGDWTATRPPT